MPVEYSRRLGWIAPDQFQAALDRFDLGRFVRVEPIPFGLFGQNVFLTSTKGKYVLRGVPHYLWQFPGERFFAQQLHEQTNVPVPWPYLFEASEDTFGWSYVIMPRMAGLQLANEKVRDGLSPADKKGIARALGVNLARMQGLTWPFAGAYDLGTDSVKPFANGFVDWMIGRIRQLLAHSRKHSDYTTAVDAEWVESLIADAQDALDVPFQPRFVMQDYKEGNMVVERVNGAWRVSGVFDLMEAYFGDGEVDLSRTVAVYLDEDPELARAFVQAYLAHKPPRSGFAERFPLYMLHDRLIIWEYFQRTGNIWWDEQWTLQEWASRYTSRIP